MHFLSRLIETPILEDPAKNHMNIHRHFYRYSKGDFIGPAIKITKTKAKITLKGTHEYEDSISEIIAKTISDPQKSFEVKGTLITGVDLSETITDLGLNWILKKSTGKTKNYKADIIDQILAIGKEMLNKHGFQIAGGQGHLKGRIIRFSHMGYVDAFDTLGAIAALESTLQGQGYDVQLGIGVAAAQRVFAEGMK